MTIASGVQAGIATAMIALAKDSAEITLRADTHDESYVGVRTVTVTDGKPTRKIAVTREDYGWEKVGKKHRDGCEHPQRTTSPVKVALGMAGLHPRYASRSLSVGASSKGCSLVAP